ncbi:MAG TPA: diguanylate cyclase [Candidatus Saccharimonadales bacterium]|nr:diguanylate cyclase [Candidatus Saccharimonadales bacterium]
MSAETTTQPYVPLEAQTAHNDELTGLPNLKAFNPRLDRLIERFPGQFGLLLIDLDDLKPINDGPGGHAAGNEYIKNAVEVINSNIRSGEDEDRQQDILFRGKTYRTGGDEFVVLLAGARSEKDVEIVKERLQKALHTANIPASMGGRAHKPDENRSDYLKDIDKLMYENKLKRKQTQYEYELSNSSLVKRTAHKAGNQLLKFSGIKKPVVR